MIPAGGMIGIDDHLWLETLNGLLLSALLCQPWEVGDLLISGKFLAYLHHCPKPKAKAEAQANADAVGKAFSLQHQRYGRKYHQNIYKDAWCLYGLFAGWFW